MQSQHPSTPTPQLRSSSLKPALLSFLAYSVVRLIGATLRFRLEDGTGRIKRGTDEVFLWALWHNRIGIMLMAYKKFVHKHTVATLVSASRDGEILACTAQRFRFQPVRGSSSRRGGQSLLEMVRWVAQGYDAVITPDGPRGPAEVVQPGILQLAKVTELPITPVSCIVSRYVRLKSWDGFIIPLPFARCFIRVGQSIPVPRNADHATLERLRLQLQERLKELGNPGLGTSQEQS